MAQRALHALQPQTFVPKTSDGRADNPSPNLLSGQPLPTAPDRAWAGDITFIPTSAGWLYLAVVIDLCSRRIIGWSLADHMRSDLVLDALRQALHTRSTNDTIFHSDRGSQYGSTLFRKALAKAGLRQSMSARANPYQNAWTESFIGTLKHEMLQEGCFENAGDARTEIFDYIAGYYNTHRKHSALGYHPPASSRPKSTPQTKPQNGPKISCTSRGFHGLQEFASKFHPCNPRNPWSMFPSIADAPLVAALRAVRLVLLCGNFHGCFWAEGRNHRDP
jgi:transposase InsO family protein